MALSLLLALQAWPAMAAPPALAVFTFELVDTSLQGGVARTPGEEQRRLEMISDQLRQMLRDKGYPVVDLAPAADALAKAGSLKDCRGCAADIAKSLGARLGLTGTVQKVSELILNINVYVWDAASRQERYRASVDIRGNNDEAWSRGISYLVRNRLLPALEKLGSD
jgi:hypothetical protein